MNAKASMFVIFVEAIIYLLLCNFHDCTFKALLLLLSKIRKQLETTEFASLVLKNHRNLIRLVLRDFHSAPLTCERLDEKQVSHHKLPSMFLHTNIKNHKTKLIAIYLKTTKTKTM